MRISTLTERKADETEIGVVYASVEGVDEASFGECLKALEEKAEALGATGIIGLQLLQSHFQWSHQTSLLATAVKE